jgi:hypothetical protein
MHPLHPLNRRGGAFYVIVANRRIKDFFSPENRKLIKQIPDWFCSQPRFIQCLFRQFFSSLDSAKSVPA